VLAVVSASTAALAAAAGHAAAAVHRADPGPAAPIVLLNAGFSEQPAGTVDVADAERVEHSSRAAAMVKSFAAERVIAAERAARSAQRKALLSANPKVVAHAMLVKYGWGASQFACLDRLWTRESKWSLTATNPTSGAYGIPQALPGTKMASVAADWRHNPLTQITWGLSYIRLRYGTPCGAWAHSEASGWY
jgi:hypothetical protein